MKVYIWTNVDFSFVLQDKIPHSLQTSHVNFNEASITIQLEPARCHYHAHTVSLSFVADVGMNFLVFYCLGNLNSVVLFSSAYTKVKFRDDTTPHLSTSFPSLGTEF